ncbi:hypothetical protein SDC9_130589 [bioreactor metagenome]|uniref:Uncharacterized protein n=1 Tax=bioreactor metagenome TaxID=1076179 RepID=A0A645D2Y1_9ZZZZ
MDVFSVNDVNVGGLYQCRTALCFGADCHGADEVLQVVPLICFSWPCVSCHSQWCYYQNAMRLKAVKQQIVQCRQRDARLAKAHIKQDCRDGVFLDVADGIFLIIMWFVFHQEFLQSAVRRPKHKL